MELSRNEQDARAAKMAQLIKAAMEELAMPATHERMRFVAMERRAKYLAYIEAGFTEDQALWLCQL